ncbi:(Fe-S)-binding protein [Chloroflexota bacterium]
MAEALQKASEALLRCNKCGFCLAGCPIYKVTGIEWTAARGRLALLSSVLDNELELHDLKEPVFNCLICNCCVDHCPSGVLTDELILKARVDLLKEQGQPWIQRLIFHKLLPNPHRLQKLTRILGWLQVSGLRSVARGLGLTMLVGDACKAERILPPVPFKHHLPSASSPKLENPKYRVAYFIGCAPNNLTPQVAEAAIRVLNKHKVEVMIPEFACCGMPAYGYGDIESALAMARKNIDLARSLEVDAIITTCATCGSMLKQYANILSDDTAYSVQAGSFSNRVKDISEFLVDIGLNTEMGTLRYRVTYHDPCHLSRFQKITSQPRQILQSIPGVELTEMAEANMCCGAAGTYSVSHYDLSMKVLARKMINVAQTDADILITCCPGCSMQLAHGIKTHGLKKMRSMELVELLDQAYQSAIKSKP